MKPELSLPGTNITAGGFTSSGTSFATPHAAAFAADLMSAWTWYQLKPYLVKAAMLAGGSKTIGGDIDRVGVGGADFWRTFYGGKGYWWSGTNAAFAGFDAADPLPRNGYVDVLQDLPASRPNVRASLVWLNRGTYTYDHRADAHAIGMDFDLAVFDPNGTLITSSASFDNPFELLRFDTTVSGAYRFRIARRRTAIRSPRSRWRCGSIGRSIEPH
jgi:Subtilase family